MIQKRRKQTPSPTASAPATAPLPFPETARQWSYRFLENWRTEQMLIRDQILDLKPKEIINVTHQGVSWTERLIQRQRTVDRILKECVTRPRDNVQPELWSILQLGAAELLYGPEDAQYAAISETVELCRYANHPEWTGFANGVLRGVQRLLSGQSSQTPAANAYPASHGNYRLLTKEIFPSPETKTGDYLAVAFSLPDALSREWTRRYSKEELFTVAWACLEASPLTVRLNRLAVEPEDWLKRCQAVGLEVAATKFPEAFQFPQKVRLSEIPGFAQGEFVVQDLTAMHAVRLLNPYPKQRVLDLCAGPGTKTTQLAELMLDQGELIATDVTQAKLDQINDNLERLQIQCGRAQWIERETPEIPGEKFDAILVDAPCSNTGVLGKRAEARWRYSINELHSLNDLQFRLLNVAAEHLAEEGRIVYSTCSIEPKENEQLIVRWLQTHPEFHCVEMQSFLPDNKQDGGFCARLERRELEENEVLDEAEDA